MSDTIGTQALIGFVDYLRKEERSPGTVEKYLRDVRSFAMWLNGREVTKELAAEWKGHLLAEHYAPVTVNAMLADINSFFRFAGWKECRVKFLKIQRRLFRDRARELTRQEYDRLPETARTLGRERLPLLMETICATGIRVSEVRYITVETVQQGRVDISLKGKIRTILLPNREFMFYCFSVCSVSVLSKKSLRIRSNAVVMVCPFSSAYSSRRSYIMRSM